MPTAFSSLPRYVAGAVHVGVALLALLRDQLPDLVVLARVERGEREVLELPLDRVDAEPVRERGEDLERLPRLLLLLVLRHRADRAHVVQAVGELDQDDPDVAGHRDHHLAVVLRLAVVAALEGDARELRQAVDELGDLVAELLLHLVERRARVLHRVVQERGAQRGRVEPHARADLGHADGVDDEVLAACPALVRVALAREEERALDGVALDLLGGLAPVLLDDGEEVAEQDALGVGELGLRPGGRVLVVLVDRAVAEVALGRPWCGRCRSRSRPASSWRSRRGTSRQASACCASSRCERPAWAWPLRPPALPCPPPASQCPPPASPCPPPHASRRASWPARWCWPSRRCGAAWAWGRV